MAMLARGKGLGVYILIIGLLFAFVVSVHTANAQDAPATGESDKIKTLNDDCVVKSPLTGRTVGKYCTVEPRIIGTKVNCIPFDAAPPGTCIVHYCDPILGICADTSLASLGSLESSFNQTLIEGSYNFDPNVFSTGYSPTGGLNSSLLNNSFGTQSYGTFGTQSLGSSYGGFGGFFQNVQNLIGPLFGVQPTTPLPACPGRMCFSVGVRG